ncbi:MAG: glycosyltransferase family 92 protein [Simkaniaceae bacterium]|nr:glycosyltransferase family 92 protein [Simkaniaceae bacterium]
MFKKAYIFFLFVALLNGNQIGIVALFHNEGPYLEEWIEYHKLVGVDHFLLYADRISDDSYTVLTPYIEEGIVEIVPWNIPDGSLYMGRQVAAYLDATERKKESQWLAFIDIDEFILPMKHRSLTECLEKYYFNSSQILVNWRNFGTCYKHLSADDKILNNLILASTRNFTTNSVTKCILRPKAIDSKNPRSFWYPHYAILKPGHRTFNGDGKPVYFKDEFAINDSKHHDFLLRINHYFTRDEAFFLSKRLAPWKEKEPGRFQFYKPEQVLEKYKNYNKVKDTEIIKYLKKYHRNDFYTYWKNK